jgi:hypothetical protein
MTEHEMSRTLVKSLPELWAECSEAESLARHLGQFGEIRITRVEPETAVAWEGEHVSGTVRLKPSNWGTRVTLTASAGGEDSAAQPVVEVPSQPIAVAVLKPPPEPAVAAEPPPTADSPPGRRRGGMFARLRALFALPEPVATPAPEPPPQPAPEPPPQPVQETRSEPALQAAPPAQSAGLPTSPDHEAALTAALDSLGQAHHRPFSRG